MKLIAEDTTSGIQRIVQFAENMDCFMQLKNSKFGEQDQMTLLRSGNDLHKMINTLLKLSIILFYL